MSALRPSKSRLRFHKSLRTSIAGFSFALSSFVLIVSVLFAVLFAYLAMQEGIEMHMSHVALSVESDVEVFFHQRFQTLNVASDFQYAHSDGHSEPDDFPIERFLGIDPSFRRVIYFSESGELLKDVSRLPTALIKPFYIDNIDFVLSSLKSGENEEYIGDIFFDGVTGEPIVNIGISARDVPDEYRGAIFAEVNLKFLWELIGNVTVGESGVAYAVDQNGSLVAFRDTSRVLRREDMTYVPSVQKWITDGTENKLFEGEGILGGHSVSMVVPVPLAGWGLVIELPHREAFDILYYILYISGAVLLFGLLVGLVMSIALARKLTAPLIQLRDFVKNIDQSNLEKRISLDTENEIGEVAEAFNGMADTLQQSYQMLEGKVAERTTDLDTKVSELEKLNEFMVNRELKMVELKTEIKKLKGRLDKTED